MLAVEPRDPGGRLILDGEAVERDRIGSTGSTRDWDIISVLCEEVLESKEGRPNSKRVSDFSPTRSGRKNDAKQLVTAQSRVPHTYQHQEAYR
jgi:hypothetical protein